MIELAALIVWLCTVKDLCIGNPPEIKYVSRYDMTKTLRFGAHAYYHEGVVYLPKGFKVKSIRDKSIVLHELVHHWQYEQNIEVDCVRAKEKLAYETQRDYLIANKAKLMPELSEFNIVMRSICFFDE